MSQEKTLIIIPTYNERDNITTLIPEIRKQLPDTHILVVDDSSPDGTSEAVKELSTKTENIFVLDREKKQGLGRAYISGFKWALKQDYELIFEMDADFSHDPKYLPDFIKAAENADLVIGSRYISGVNVINWPMSRLLISYFGNVYARIIAGIPVRDCTSGFKCFHSRVLKSINLNKVDSSGYAFQVEMNFHVWKQGYHIEEIPIIFTDRRVGQSKMSSKIVREALILLWKLRLMSIFYSGKR